MMKMMRKRGGFTLIEVLIVIVILGILAALAIPIFSQNVVRTYRAEALQQIEALRSSLARYFSLNGATYVGATLGVGGTLDYDPNNVATQGGQTQNFTYAVGGLAPATYTITATRGATNAPGITLGQTVTMNEAGVAGGTFPT